MHKTNYSILSKYREEYESVSMSDEAVRRMQERIREGKEEKKNMRKKKFYKRMTGAAAAVAVLALIALPNISSQIACAMGEIPVLGNLVKVVTFRDYQYDNGKQTADVIAPEIEVDTKNTSTSVASTAAKSSEEINAEIEKLTDKWVNEFKENMKQDGYQNVTIKSEVINTTNNYFTLKLICSQRAGSGYEENHFYTISLDTGKRMKLSDLFKEGSDYLTPISESIQKQMRQQMKSDENIKYWLDDEEIPDWNLDEITKDAAFYVNKAGEVVICYTQGDVAPMYMGSVEFVIPNDVLTDIRV